MKHCKVNPITSKLPVSRSMKHLQFYSESLFSSFANKYDSFFIDNRAMMVGHIYCTDAEFNEIKRRYVIKLKTKTKYGYVYDVVAGDAYGRIRSYDKIQYS